MLKILSPNVGEAPEGTYSVRDGTGKVADPNGAIFPILKQLDSGYFTLIGTGFFIADNGVFATAKHVLLDVCDRNGNQLHPICIVHYLSRNRFVLRNVLRCTWNNIADVAVGVAEQKIDPRTGDILKNRLVTLSVLRPTIGDDVFTYAYPKAVIRLESKNECYFFPQYYEGKLEQFYPDGRDRVMMAAPCYRTNMPIYAGASGGPVFGLHGAAFGINSSDIEGSDPPISFVSRINELLPLAVTGVLLPGTSEPAAITVRELAEKEFLVFDPPLRHVIAAWERRNRKENNRSIGFLFGCVPEASGKR
jgi:hypothetical protein